MNDMTPVIVPKSDQISADDFLSGPQTYVIESVEIRPGTEQPVSVFLRGEQRAWKPCKSMSRVLVAAWGPDAKAYVGRSVTLYRDPKVKWGGMEVGGIRVSHMSDIEREFSMALTATKGKRAPYVVKMLQAPARDNSAAEKWVTDHLGFVRGAADLDALDAVIAGGSKAMAKLESADPALHQRVTDAYAARRSALSDADPFEGRADSDHGEDHTGSIAGDFNDETGRDS